MYIRLTETATVSRLVMTSTSFAVLKAKVEVPVEVLGLVVSRFGGWRLAAVCKDLWGRLQDAFTQWKFENLFPGMAQRHPLTVYPHLLTLRNYVVPHAFPVGFEHRFHCSSLTGAFFWNDGFMTCYRFNPNSGFTPFECASLPTQMLQIEPPLHLYANDKYVVLIQYRAAAKCLFVAMLNLETRRWTLLPSIPYQTLSNRVRSQPVVVSADARCINLMWIVEGSEHHYEIMCNPPVVWDNSGGFEAGLPVNMTRRKEGMRWSYDESLPFAHSRYGMYFLEGGTLQLLRGVKKHYVWHMKWLSVASRLNYDRVLHVGGDFLLARRKPQRRDTSETYDVFRIDMRKILHNGDISQISGDMFQIEVRGKTRSGATLHNTAIDHGAITFDGLLPSFACGDALVGFDDGGVVAFHFVPGH